MKTIGYFILFLLPFLSTDQEIKVLDKETGKPIYNVSVYTEDPSLILQQTKKGVVDISAVKIKDILILSHISYA